MLVAYICRLNFSRLQQTLGCFLSPYLHKISYFLVKYFTNSSHVYLTSQNKRRSHVSIKKSLKYLHVIWLHTVTSLTLRKLCSLKNVFLPIIAFMYYNTLLPAFVVVLAQL